MEDKIKRTKSVQVRLTKEEFDYLNRKFEMSGLKSKSEKSRDLEESINDINSHFL